MKRVIISGGGTGGHIYPAITIVKEMSRMEPTEFLYVGSKNGLESEIVPQENIPFTTLEVQSLARKLTPKNLVSLGKSATAVAKAIGIIKKFKPDVVIGTGGYVCGPIVLAAHFCGVPTLIQEQNVIAGITNKILSRFVDVVAVGYVEALSAFKHAKRVVYTGNPVRLGVQSYTREEGRAYLHALSDDFIVLVTGGSRGARSINSAMIDVHRHFKDEKNIKLIHATGTTEYMRVLDALDIEPGKENAYKTGVMYGEGSIIVPYFYDMPKVLAGTDLAIFRAGAVGLAELTVRGIPSILIPYPYASEDHQTYNARSLVINGAAKMIVDSVLSSPDLIGEITHLQHNPKQLASMAEASKAMGSPDAANKIATLAFSIAK